MLVVNILNKINYKGLTYPSSRSGTSATSDSMTSLCARRRRRGSGTGTEATPAAI